MSEISLDWCLEFVKGNLGTFNEDLCHWMLCAVWRWLSSQLVSCLPLNVPVPYLIEFCNQVISQVVHRLTPLQSLTTFTKIIQSCKKPRAEAFLLDILSGKSGEQNFLSKEWAEVEREACACVYGANQSLPGECGRPVLAAVGFLLVHLKQQALTAEEN